MKRLFRVYDPVLFWLAVAATVIGLFFIFDAGYAIALDKDKSVLPSESKSQTIVAFAAILISTVVAAVQPGRMRKIGGWLLAACFLGLAVVDRFGREVNGAKRWISIPPITVQPSEFVKLAVVLYLAAVFADRKLWPRKIARRRDWVQWIDTIAIPKLRRAGPALWALLAILVIEKEKDMGTASVVAVVTFAMFFPARVSWKSMLAVVAIAGLGGWYLVTKEPYRMERIANHANRWDPENVQGPTFQSVEAELAIATGGYFGVGIGNGRAKEVLPETTTDFVMATVGEETGVVGSLIVMALLGAIALRLFWHASRATDRFAMLTLYGVGCWIGVQACVNVMMANGFLPAIGIPLPFISSGGSSLLALWLALGICQSTFAPAPAPAVPPGSEPPDSTPPAGVAPFGPRFSVGAEDYAVAGRPYN